MEPQVLSPLWLCVCWTLAPHQVRRPTHAELSAKTLCTECNILKSNLAQHIYPKAPQQIASSLEFLLLEIRSRYTRRRKNTVAEIVNRRNRSHKVIV